LRRPLVFILLLLLLLLAARFLVVLPLPLTPLLSATSTTVRGPFTYSVVAEEVAVAVEAVLALALLLV
jgi:hypothetical protein